MEDRRSRFFKYYTPFRKRVVVATKIVSETFPAVSAAQVRLLMFAARTTARTCNKMSGQMKITRFFTVTPKRAAEDQGGNNYLKRKKLETNIPSSPNKENSDQNVQQVDDKLNCTPEKEQITDSITDQHNPPVKLSPEQELKTDENRLKDVGKLFEQQTSGLVRDVDVSWLKVLEPEFKKPYFQKLEQFVEMERQENNVFPTPENVFSWTRACTVKDVKVVILGQDPYHGPNQAHGLSFSVLPGKQAQPSLQNIYKELEKDIDGFTTPKHGYLQGWAKQGVLMLNAVLTVRAHQAKSHRDKGWEKFTDAIVSYLNKNRSGLVFILWGSHAQKKRSQIDKKKHCVLTGVHPSPLSAHRGFFGCKHFSKCNEYLQQWGKTPIDWNDLPLQ